MRFVILYLSIIFGFIAVYSVPICDVITATNIGDVFPSWECVMNVPITNACQWSGINCTDYQISSIDLSFTKVTGNLYEFFVMYTILLTFFCRYYSPNYW